MTDKHEQNPTSAVNFVEKIPCPFDEVNIEPNLVHKVVINNLKLVDIEWKLFLLSKTFRIS